jgi:hypothetical protein
MYVKWGNTEFHNESFIIVSYSRLNDTKANESESKTQVSENCSVKFTIENTEG